MSDAMTLEEIREVGLATLLDVLGPVGLIRFMQQFENGRGNYTEERRACLKDLTVEDFVREAQKRQSG